VIGPDFDAANSSTLSRTSSSQLSRSHSQRNGTRETKRSRTAERAIASFDARARWERPKDSDDLGFGLAATVGLVKGLAYGRLYRVRPGV